MLGVRQGLVVVALASVFALGCRSTSHDTSPPRQRTPSSVNEVIALVAASDLHFEYLTKDHIHVETGPEMADSLHKRYSAAGEPDESPDSFIRRFATWSDSDKARYWVRLPDGQHVGMGDWLHEQIHGR